MVAVPATARDSRLVTQRQIAPQTIQRTGPTGIHLCLHTGRGSHPAPRHAEFAYRQVPVGRAVQINGTTSPEVSHARVQIGEISTTSHHRATIATVLTHADGRFNATWLPHRPGNYTITAAIKHAPGGLLADRNCDVALTAVASQ